MNKLIKIEIYFVGLSRKALWGRYPQCVFEAPGGPARMYVGLLISFGEPDVALD